METESVQTSHSRRRPSLKKIIVIVVALIIIIGAGGFFAYKKGLISIGSQQGKTVATVDGTAIHEHDLDIRFNQLKDTYTQQGVNLNDANTVSTIKKQIVDEMVNEELVLEDAKKKNITVTDAEVTDSMNQLVAAAGSQDALNTQVKQYGMTQADLQNTVKRNLILQKYVDQYTAQQNITVSEDEITQAYQQMTAGQPATSTPALKDVHDQVAAQVKSQKVAQQILVLVNQLKQNAKVQVLI
jgi:FKBP-type peptidyl-prolyl cis-trans isomerase (trigger factor)